LEGLSLYLGGLGVFPQENFENTDFLCFSEVRELPGNMLLKFPIDFGKIIYLVFSEIILSM